MFWYGVCVGSDSKFDQYARRGIESMGAIDRLLLRRRQSSIFAAYNSIIDEVLSTGSSFDGLVFLHEDFEITDAAFESKLRALLDDDVAIVGTVGGRGPTGVQWDRAEHRFGRQPDPFSANDYGGGTHDVDMVDGCLMALSPWAVEALRFDERFGGFHGYDADICLQARAAGRRVLVAELDGFHHTKGGFGDTAHHQRVDDRFRRKWNLDRAPLSLRLRRRSPRLWRLLRLGLTPVRRLR